MLSGQSARRALAWSWRAHGQYRLRQRFRVMGQGHNTIDCNPALLDAYKKFYTTLRVRQAKVCFFLAMLLVPACIGLDWCVYPKLAVPMFKARLWCDLAMLPFFLALFTTWGRRHVRWFDSVPLITAAVAICWMIYM